jgi:hypothetical protein
VSAAAPVLVRYVFVTCKGTNLHLRCTVADNRRKFSDVPTPESPVRTSLGTCPRRYVGTGTDTGMARFIVLPKVTKMLFTNRSV